MICSRGAGKRNIKTTVTVITYVVGCFCDASRLVTSAINALPGLSGLQWAHGGDAFFQIRRAFIQLLHTGVHDTDPNEQSSASLQHFLLGGGKSSFRGGGGRSPRPSYSHWSVGGGVGGRGLFFFLTSMENSSLDHFFGQ